MEINHKVLELIKFVNEIRLRNMGGIHFNDFEKEIILRWGYSDYIIKSKINAMRKLGLIVLHDSAPNVWVLRAFNEKYDTTKDEEEANKIIGELK